LQTTTTLIEQRQEQLNRKGITLISESGLHTADDLKVVREAGVHAVLIGESLLVKPDPSSAIRSLYNG
ncbi:MAG: indole-3-glycerol-phosphate synthase TrpC, partial [Cyanobacteria bacterium]|nr:indole-3-glycerol-phosphate synthase TrpC [Cyanobacteria bacterium GSL.Bin21]